MAEYNQFYQRAIYYDIAFGRDVTGEVEFIRHVYFNLLGKAPDSLLDLACGPGYHARTFARRGRAVGLDLREEMIAFAQSLAEQDEVTVEWIAQDMRCLQLDAPVDIAINVFDGIDCLTRNEDLIAHLQSITANLTPGGLYFIDVTNPTYTSLSYYGNFSYSGERDGVKVDVVWGINDPYVDPQTGIAHTRMKMVVNDNGNVTEIVDEADERVLSAQEITLLAALAGGLQPVAWYGAYDLDTPYDRFSERMIVVLQKID